jgi:sugar/nucleoside kinase (ribokinase family)
MPETRYDVLTVGNAIVDIMAHAEDDFLVAQGLTRGSMRLIDAREADRLYDLMGPAIETSGGCAGNTAAGVASFGGSAAFIGKVADDQFGKLYRHDMRAIGVAFDTAPLADGTPTARSMILVSPDGERTMNTYLGACQNLTNADVDRDTVAAAAITYLEGYLWDPPHAKDAFRRTAEFAHSAGRQVSLTLSDSFCVDRYREEFLDLIRNRTVDILFANESEVRSLYQTADFETGVHALQKDCRIAAVTMGAEGALVVTHDGVRRVSATPVETVVDTTGAGDLFAAGFLFAHARGMSLTDAARLGTVAAAEVIGHIGPRPAVSLADLARQSGFDL